MSTKLIKHTTGVLDHNYAREYLNLPESEYENAIKGQRVVEYTRRIDEGLMIDCQIATAIVPVNNETVTFKLNGKHCCAALLSSNRSILLCTSFATYAFDSLQTFNRYVWLKRRSCLLSALAETENQKEGR